jgi:hypothetical protein
MTVSEEPTLYDVLEVDPESSTDELRAAVERARETYGPESVAVYALVDESQIEELRAKLDEAEEVLLDPARRIAYDRSIGRLAPATLWAEDDDDEEGEPLPPIEAGPHARVGDLELDAEADDAGGEEDEEEDEAPRQQAFALDVGGAPGAFGRTADTEAPARPEALLSGDWAAAVPGDAVARPPPEPLPVSVLSPEPVAVLPTVEEERTGLPPSLGLRVKPADQAPGPEEEVPAAPPPLPPAAPLAPPPMAAPERPPELPGRPREGLGKLEIPSDAEFNGELLRRVRESYGLSLQQVAERTRITRLHLENVEADRYDRLPATVYLRGILVNLARELRLDPARVSKTYLLAAQRAHARAP